MVRHSCGDLCNCGTVHGCVCGGCGKPVVFDDSSGDKFVFDRVMVVTVVSCSVLFVLLTVVFPSVPWRW